MPECQTLVHAGVLVTQDAERRILVPGGLAIADGVILDVGPADELAARWQPRERLDLGTMLVLPGLVNAHSHAAMTFLRGLADDMPLMEWLTGRIFPVEARLTADIVRTGSLLGFAEMLRTGTTACMDMYLFEGAVLEAAEEAGLRCTGGEAVFGFPSAACPDAATALAATRGLAERYAGHGRISVAVNCHSVYTTTPEIMAACRDLALELDLPFHMHLSETRDETARSLAEHGRRPVEYCQSLGVLEARCTFAHVVDVTEPELDLLAAAGAAVVHNPSSNMKLASGAAPVAAMLGRGMTVALGTDGPASNNQCNLFQEMGRAALLHKLVSGDPATVPATAVLDMATLGGATALRAPRQGQPGLGALAPGMAADLIALDLAEPNLQPMYAPVSHLVYAATGHEVRLAMVAGEVLYRDGRFSRFDYDALRREVRALRDFVLGKAGLDAVGGLA